MPSQDSPDSGIPASLESSVVRYLQTRHCRATVEWIRAHLPANISFAVSSAGQYEEEIYRRWVDSNWNDPEFGIARNSTPALPDTLHIDNVNEQKLTFNGHYLLQINHINDISKPLDYELLEQIAETQGSDDEQSDGDDNNIGKLLKGKGKKADSKKKAPKNPDKFLKFGARMLQLSLFDGHNECIGIEYMPLPMLKPDMVGAKILLSGPFDVRYGNILLRPQNVQVISSVTFDVNAVPGTGPLFPGPPSMSPIRQPWLPPNEPSTRNTNQQRSSVLNNTAELNDIINSFDNDDFEDIVIDVD